MQFHGFCQYFVLFLGLCMKFLRLYCECVSLHQQRVLRRVCLVFSFPLHRYIRVLWLEEVRVRRLIPLQKMP